MNIRWWNDNSKLEARLRAERPEAPEDLVRSLSVRARRRGLRPAPRIALAGVASVVMLVGLAAAGGIGRAASEVVHVVRVATGHTDTFGKRMAIHVVNFSAASDEYGGGGGGGGGGTTTTTSTTPTQTTSTASQPTSTSQSAATTAGTSGAVTVQTPPSTNTATPPTVISVVWPTGTFTTNVVVTANTAPASVTNSALLGDKNGDNKLISIVATDSSGNVIHQLAQPLDVSFTNPPKGFVPAVSSDGVTYRALTKIAAPPLPDDMQDAYYVAADGTIHILTRHLTIFAVLYSANVNVSESGKKTPQAGSGLFGDPTRNHVGAPKLEEVGTTITPKAVKGATVVPFAFFVDEQAATYISIYDAKGNPVVIDRNGTTIRGHRTSGTPVKAMHVVILRPGTIKTGLRIPAGVLESGETYKIRVTAIDFDGHKTISYVTFTA